MLFSIVRVPSLKSLGLSGQELIDNGVYLLNMQMAGMLIGGILWGILGDLKGRLKIMFGSIFLYSIANLLNGTVTSLPAYALLRFVAGIGLAGELGAGITLVAPDDLSPTDRMHLEQVLQAARQIFSSGSFLAEDRPGRPGDPSADGPSCPGRRHRGSQVRAALNLHRVPHPAESAVSVQPDR